MTRARMLVSNVAKLDASGGYTSVFVGLEFRSHLGTAGTYSEGT